MRQTGPYLRVAQLQLVDATERDTFLSERGVSP
jgi:hypothetical protein